VCVSEFLLELIFDHYFHGLCDLFLDKKRRKYTKAVIRSEDTVVAAPPSVMSSLKGIISNMRSRRGNPYLTFTDEGDHEDESEMNIKMVEVTSGRETIDNSVVRSSDDSHDEEN